jgi:hypothetical protein
MHIIGSVALCFKPLHSVFNYLSIQALVKQQFRADHLSTAWQYPGQELDIVPANYSRMTSM